MKSFNDFLTEQSRGPLLYTLKEWETFFQNHESAILSAERDDNSGGENKSATAKLESALRSSGYTFERAKGGFVENKGTPDEKAVDGERSFVVTDTHRVGGLKKFAQKMGQKFDQDAILYVVKGRASLIGTTKNRDVDPKFGQKMAIGKAKFGVKGEYYTKVKDGYFTFG